MKTTRRAALTAAAGIAATIAVGSTEAANASPYGGKFVAHFVYASTSVSSNEAKFRAMKADAITFGYRIKPSSASAFPAEVQAEIRRQGYNQIFEYTGKISWDNTRYYRNPIQVGAVSYDPIPIPNSRAIVITRNDGDANAALIRAARNVGARAIVGMPAPIMRKDVPWLPDLSYMNVIEHFTYRFVDEYARRGAHGFYHHVEMPVTDTAYWQPVRDLYRLQNRMVQMHRPGMVTIVSPYLEARRGKATFTPAQAARGASMLLSTSSGTNMLISPQDGLGTGTTALAADRSTRHIATTEQYLAAMKGALGHRLLSTVEGMTPGGGSASTRGATTYARVAQQLRAEGAYTRGHIGFMWDGRTPLRNLGVSGLGAGFSTV